MEFWYAFQSYYIQPVKQSAHKFSWKNFVLDNDQRELKGGLKI